MSDSIELLAAPLVRTTVFASVMGVGVSLLLRVARVRSARLERVAWTLVLLQGWLFWQQPVPVPEFLRIGRESDVVTYDSTTSSMKSDPPANAFINDGSGRAGDLATTRRESEVSRAGAGKRPATGCAPQLVSGLLFAWLGGGLLIAAFSLFAYLRFVRKARSFVIAPAEWSAQWEALLHSAGVTASIPLWTSRDSGPMLCRLPGQYVVVVPREGWTSFTPEQRLSVLLHELEHYRRRDVWKSFAARMLAWPQWFNPLIWFALRRIDDCAERACDEQVRSELPEFVTDYARALLDLTHSPRGPSLASAAGNRGLASRVRCLLSPSPRKDSRMKSCCLILIASMFAGLGALRPDLVADDATPTITSTSVVISAVDEKQPSPPVNVDDEAKDEGSSLDVWFTGPAAGDNVAVAPSDRNPDEAYVDMKQLFDNEPGFCAARDRLKKSIAASELNIRKLVDEARTAAEMAQKAESDSDVSREERQILRSVASEKKARIEQDQNAIRQLMLQREADLYQATFQRIKDAIAEYARANGIRIVRRKQAAVVGGPDDASRDPKDTIRLINQDILFNADEPLDITEPVLELLKQKAEQAK